MPRIPKAKDTPVIKTKRTESSDFPAGQDVPRVQHADPKPGQKPLDDACIQPVDRPVDDEKMAMLQFMAQPVQVRIATTADKQAEQMFEINVNGDLHFFRRGETKTVPRYIVDRLARMKQTTYTQQEVTAGDGARNIVNIPTTSLKYDFSVENDPHPRGREWLQATMAEA